jgi:hypothetical protein
MAIRYDAVTKPVTKPRNETPDVTKPSVRLMTPEQAVQFGTPLWAKELVASRPRAGRPPAGAVAMSVAERVRRYRERRRGAVAAS